MLSVLKSASSVRDASDKVLHDFENPLNQSTSVEVTRANKGEEYFNKYSGTQPGPQNTKVIEDAVTWAVNIANDDSHGYDQTNRWGPNYDCSSLVISAYQQAGCPVKTNGATYTENMKTAFVKTGFDAINYTQGMQLIRGDVILKYGHTVMYIGNGQIVSASSNEFGGSTGGQTGDQTGKEVKVSNFYNDSWHTVLRLPSTFKPSGGGGTPQPEIINSKMPLIMLILATEND